MLSLYRFRHNLYPVFRLSVETPLTFEVVHDRKVFDVTVQLTDKKPSLQRKPRKRRKGSKIKFVDVHLCPLCNDMAVAGICMNKECINSQLKQ